MASSSDGTKLMAVVYGGQVYTSTNSGVTWTARESNRDWTSVASSSDGTKLVAVVFLGGQIYTSVDSGLTWTTQENAGQRYWASVASSADGSKLVAVDKYSSDSNGGQIYTGQNFPAIIRAGGQGSSGQFQYLGNGTWQQLSPTVNGSTLTGLNPANLSAGTANINISGNAATATSATTATTATTTTGISGGALTTVTNIANGQIATQALNATNLTGTIADARLSSNVALRSAVNNFTGASNTFSGPVGIGTATPSQALEVNGNAQVNETLYFPPTLGDKLWLWSPTSSSSLDGYGLGIQSLQLQVYCYSNAAIVFGQGASASFTEKMRIASSGNVGIGTNNPGSKLSVNGTISSPMWNAATVINTPGSLPLSGSFNSGGGTLMITASGSGYTSTAGQNIGMNVLIDGTVRVVCTIYANAATTHLAFVQKTIVVSGIPAGAHTVQIQAHSGTLTDGNDGFCVSVLELPF
ncbi:MAG: hypothetical protein HZA89_17400 [Verrucomicrobia bacterium]|nr:hypothetical protein [Verrucomicrobiota bacterium]